MKLTRNLLRPDDLLNLQIETDNLRLDISRHNDPALILDNPNKPGYLIVHFPPQTVVEQAVYESSPSIKTGDEGKPYNTEVPPETPPSLPAQARIGGPSRLVFRIPEDSDQRIPYTTAGLLDWEDLDLVVSPLAGVPPEPSSQEAQQAPSIQEPLPTETAIELPYRLVISPNQNVAWRNALNPVTHRGFAELWHTRLVKRATDGKVSELTRSNPAPLRAIWSPDFNFDKLKMTDPPVFAAPDQDWPGVLTPMTASDRHEIVVLTSGFHGYIRDIEDYRSYEPRPFWAEKLMLSPLGGWLKSRGEWDPPVPFRPFPFVTPIYRTLWSSYLHDLTLLQQAPRVGQQRRAKRADVPPNFLPLPENLFKPGEDTANFAEGKILSPLTDGLEDTLPLYTNVIGSIIWPQPRGEKGSLLNLSEWTHIATLGRDHYVRIVYEGHLYPFGHRAALIKVTERKIRDVPMPDGTTAPLAYLIQRQFIVVRQPLRDYMTPEVHQQLEDGGRGLPLRSIRLTDLVTPDIADPKNGALIPGSAYSFWVRLGTGADPEDDFKFHCIAEDIAGNLVNFTTSLIFIPFGEEFTNASDPGPKTGRAAVYDRYQKSGEERACLVLGQKVSYAPAEASNENTTLTTNALYFQTHDAPPGKKFGGFLPKLLKASVKLPAVEAMLGRPAETTIGYYEPYLKQAANNTTDLFATIVKEVLPGQIGPDKLLSAFSADQAGGFATPNLAISGLTSTLGPLAGDLASAANDIFDPSDFFGDALVKDAAKLFGTLSLGDLLWSSTMSAGAPKIQLKKEEVPVPPPAQKLKLIATLDWTPELKPEGFSLVIVSFHPKKKGVDGKLVVHGRMEKIIELPPPAVADPGFMKLDGSLTNFTIELLHVVEVLFNEFSFHTETSKKLDVNVDLDHDTPVRFIDDLQFVEELRKVIPPKLFGDGPSLDINLTRVKAGFNIGLPSISVAVFSLSEVTLSAFLELPFLDGRPTFDFGFSSREHPFNLTVMFFGGGGFFHLQVDTLGVKMLEAALEFGASASVDLGVASGGVHMAAGIYFKMERKTIEGNEVDAATLTGYFRMGGELSVLGLISLSLEFYLGFSYEFSKNAAYGRATLTVKVEVLFFSTSVEITVEKRFGGSGGDPSFLDGFTTQEVWDEYAGAFA